MAIIASDPAAVARAKGGGGKLSRSETVTVRLDPKLNYLCELAARAQRRTKSSFIEWAIADALGSVNLPEVAGYKGEPVTIAERAAELYQVDEADRLVKLAFNAPALMTHEEQLIWRTLREFGYVWLGRWDKQFSVERWTWYVDQESILLERVREVWDVLKEVALGERPATDLPSYSKERAPPSDAKGFNDDWGIKDDLDDNTPF